MSEQRTSGSSPLIPPAAKDDIPVEELIRITREFTRRVTNQDRQRLALDLRESGHQRIIQTHAPLLLQRFFAGETDLDSELSWRFSSAPLLSHAEFNPAPGEPLARQAGAIFTSQDDSMAMIWETHPGDAVEVPLDVTFTLSGMLGQRFPLNALLTLDRRRWLDLMRRENGIAFLWTRDRWEQPYLVCVVREYFARLYAFSPTGAEAAVRLTPDMVTALLDWLESLWFAAPYSAPARSSDAPAPAPEPPPAETWDEPPDSAGPPDDSTPPTDLEW